MESRDIYMHTYNFVLLMSIVAKYQFTTGFMQVGLSGWRVDLRVLGSISKLKETFYNRSGGTTTSIHHLDHTIEEIGIMHV